MVKKAATLGTRRKKGIINPGEPSNNVVSSLVAKLRELAPSVSDPEILMAADFASRWIHQYRQRVSSESHADRQFHSERAKARKELKALSRTIEKLAGRPGIPALLPSAGTKARNGKPKICGMLDALSPAAKEAVDGKEKLFSRTFVARRASDEGKEAHPHEWIAVKAELDDVQRLLRTLLVGVDLAADMLAPLRPSKYFNPDNLLACGMCQTLGSCLRVKVAMTRRSGSPTEKPASANYWKLLELAFQLAGAQPQEDLLPIMRSGAKLAYPSGKPFGTAPSERMKKG